MGRVNVFISFRCPSPVVDGQQLAEDDLLRLNNVLVVVVGISADGS